MIDLNKVSDDVKKLFDNYLDDLDTLFLYLSSYYNIKLYNIESLIIFAKDKISSKHNISPIEVKSTNNYTINSLNKFIRKYNNQLDVPYVLHTADLKIENGIVYLPLYMTELL